MTEAGPLSWAPQGQRPMCGMRVPGPLPCAQKALLPQGGQSILRTLITEVSVGSTIKEEAQVHLGTQPATGFLDSQAAGQQGPQEEASVPGARCLLSAIVAQSMDLRPHLSLAEWTEATSETGP